MKWRSQYGQDRYIAEELFPGKTDGVFVEVGAYDGISISNTYSLEKLGWTGLLVEPNPDMEFSLLANRRAAVEMVCAGDGHGTLTYRKITGPCDVLSGLVADYDPLHVARIYHEVASKGGAIRDIQVPVMPLWTLLKRHGLRIIDYLSIDTEGSELAVLRGINWRAGLIPAITVEDNYGDRSVERYLAERGYEKRARLGDDDLYVWNP